MTGENTGERFCHLNRYDSIVWYLNSKGDLSPGDLADLEYELFVAMGECGRRCIDTCLATSFYGIQNNPSPHTRHPREPSAWIVETDAQPIELTGETAVDVRL